MGFLAGAGSLIGGAMGLFGGGSNQPSGPPMFNMPNMGEAANNAFGGIGNLSGYGNTAQGIMPLAGSTFQNLYNNPYAQLFQGGANTAGGLGMNAALGAYGTGGALQQAGLGTIPMAGQIFNTAFDPQSALYARTQQQQQEQTQAMLQGSGIGGTPYGQGVAGMTNANFNIDWQNNQLQRQILGAQGAGGLLTAGGNLANLGTGIQNLAPMQFANAAGMGMNAFNTIGGNQNNAIQSLLGLTGGAQDISNVQIQDYLNYIGAGNQAGQVANQNYANQLRANQQQFNQQMAFGGMLGGGLYGLSQTPFGQQWGFGGSGWGGGNNNYFNAGGDFISNGQVIPG